MFTKDYLLEELGYPLERVFLLEEYESLRGSIRVTISGGAPHVQVIGQDQSIFRALTHSIERLWKLAKQVNTI